MQEADVYPSIWDEGQGALDYLKAHYQGLTAFLAAAAAAGDAVILWLA